MPFCICAEFPKRHYSRVSSGVTVASMDAAGLSCRLVRHFSFPDVQPKRFAVNRPAAYRDSRVFHQLCSVFVWDGCHHPFVRRHIRQRDVLRAEGRWKMEDGGWGGERSRKSEVRSQIISNWVDCFAGFCVVVAFGYGGQLLSRAALDGTLG